MMAVVFLISSSAFSNSLLNTSFSCKGKKKQKHDKNIQLYIHKEKEELMVQILF